MAANDRGTKNVIIYNEAGNSVGDNTTPMVTYMVDTAKATYSAAAAAFGVATNPTDIFTLTGSASKTIRITRIAVTGTQTTGGMRDVLLIKRSAANTGGTSSTLTAVPHDSTSAAATATARSYTVNPSGLGTTVGTMRAEKVQISATTGVAGSLIADFGPRYGQAIVLRGTGEVISVNLNGVTSTGNSMTCCIEWTEE
jgi:hypothetical protein